MATTPVFLPGEFHGQRSLAGYSPGGHKESDTTERLTDFSFKRESQRKAVSQFKDVSCWEFPGSPVVRTPSFHFCGLGSMPGWVIKILQASW